MKLTDEQIRELREAGAIDERTYRGAILVPKHHGSLGRRVRRECRARIIKLLKERSK